MKYQRHIQGGAQGAQAPPLANYYFAIKAIMEKKQIELHVYNVINRLLDVVLFKLLCRPIKLHIPYKLLILVGVVCSRLIKTTPDYMCFRSH